MISNKIGSVDNRDLEENRQLLDSVSNLFKLLAGIEEIESES